jgi:prepilin peptidase CpaA
VEIPQTALTIIQGVAAVSFPLFMAYAAVSDFRYYQIPNWLSAAVAVAFLPAALLGGIDSLTLGVHYGTGLALFAGGAILFTLGLLGGGDVKLLAAAGVWVGWAEIAPYLLFVALLGGALALIVLFLRRLADKLPFLAGVPWLSQHLVKEQDIPYGVAIGLAAIFMFFWGYSVTAY